MWHEARRQERKIRGMLVDYRKRAERRRDFYEKIKADPTQFLQVHGRQCKIHLDPAIATAADSAVMMPWQGNDNNLIDRFDVRAHLDIIQPVKKRDDIELTTEERQLNYERYRIVAQNAYLGISEEKFLKQLHMEEQFGYTETKSRKEPKGTGVAIGFNYEDNTAIATAPSMDSPDQYDDDNSDSDLDVDLSINVSKIDSSQAHEMNKNGQQFGMSGNDFYSFLTNDMEEAESYKLAKEEEHEKALYSGRKSRRERRAHREKRLANRKISPPSYAAKESPTHSYLRDESKSPSKSPSPEAEKITYITSFGDDEEPASSSKTSYADKVKYGKPKPKPVEYKRKRSSSREMSRDRNYRYRSRSRRSDSIRRSRSGSRRTPTRSRRSRDLSFSPRNKRRRSRSRSRSRSRRTSRRKSSSSSLSSSSSSAKRSTPKSSTSSSPLSSSTDSSPRRSKSKSRSASKDSSLRKSPVAPSPPRIRYYGRKRSDKSSSESSSSSSDNDETKSDLPSSSQSNNRSGNNSGNVSKKSSSTMTVMERLKLKRQALINRQFKKDKIAEVQKIMREKQAQQTREDELREMAIKLRRRQRELRHAYDRSSTSGSETTDESKKRDKTPSPVRSQSSHKSDRGDKYKSHRRRSSSSDRSRRNRSRSRSDRRYRSRSSSQKRGKRGRSNDSNKKLVDY